MIMFYFYLRAKNPKELFLCLGYLFTSLGDSRRGTFLVACVRLITHYYRNNLAKYDMSATASAEFLV